MPLLLFDYECPQCQTIEEHMVAAHDEVVSCEKCGAVMAKVFVSAGSRLPDDAAWIKTVLEVVAKDSTKPATREFLRNPTRENMRRWMKAEGVRHLEDGEKPARIDYEADHRRRTEYAERRHFERRAITVRGG